MLYIRLISWKHSNHLEVIWLDYLQMQGFYRNHMEEVIKFFESHHKVSTSICCRFLLPKCNESLIYKLLVSNIMSTIWRNTTNFSWTKDYLYLLIWLLINWLIACFIILHISSIRMESDHFTVWSFPQPNIWGQVFLENFDIWIY